tara:strand:+ start:108 stop:338 length:231 start_codon:yes stop_codon:yes gene_type:complete
LSLLFCNLKNNLTLRTQKAQYAEDDNHHVQPNTFGNGGVVLVGQGGSVLSGSVPTYVLRLSPKLPISYQVAKMKII